MNFQQVYNIRDQKDDKNYPKKLEMFGVLNSLEMPDQYGNVKCKVTDDTGKERTVTFRGQTTPQGNMKGLRVLFQCWAESYTGKDGQPRVSFKAWLKSANVAQKSPQQAPQPLQQANTQQQPAQCKDDCICRQTAGKCVAEMINLNMDVFQNSNQMLETFFELAVPIADWFGSGKIMLNTPQPQQVEVQRTQSNEDGPQVDEDGIPF